MNKNGWAALGLAAIVVLVLGAACSAPAPQPVKQVAAPNSPAPQALAPVGPTLDSQRSGDVSGWLLSNPTQPTRGAAELDAYLLGVDGQPISDAKVTFDIDMTNMSHGPNMVAATPIAVGHYAGRVHFMMPGPWRVIAIVERPGRETAKLRFEFMVNSR